MMDNENKTRYSDAELVEFKAIVEEKIKQANEQLNYYLQQLSEFGASEEAKIRSLEDGNSSSESERLTNLAARQRKLIRHLDSALARIESKTYGVCRETGKLISKERLKAVPHATLSIEAKQSKRK